MNIYAAMKAVHVTCVAVSVGGFVLRFGCTVVRPALLQMRVVRIAPHVVDTILLTSGVAMAFQLGMAGVSSWLPAKIGALVVYIVLGGVALRRGAKTGSGLTAAVAALVAIMYIVAVAVRKTPWPITA